MHSGNPKYCAFRLWRIFRKNRTQVLSELCFTALPIFSACQCNCNCNVVVLQMAPPPSSHTRRVMASEIVVISDDETPVTPPPVPRSTLVGRRFFNRPRPIGPPPCQRCDGIDFIGYGPQGVTSPCYWCGEIGQHLLSCQWPVLWSPDICPRCGRQGHVERDCTTSPDWHMLCMECCEELDRESSPELEVGEASHAPPEEDGGVIIISDDEDNRD